MCVCPCAEEVKMLLIQYTYLLHHIIYTEATTDCTSDKSNDDSNTNGDDNSVNNNQDCFP